MLKKQIKIYKTCDFFFFGKKKQLCRPNLTPTKTNFCAGFASSITKPPVAKPPVLLISENCDYFNKPHFQTIGLISTNKLLEFSETTRVTSYFLDKFNFGHYLAGLMDADGTISITKKNYISIEITLAEKDVKTLYKIRKILGLELLANVVELKLHELE